MKKLSRVPFFGAFTQEVRDVIVEAINQEGDSPLVLNLCSGSWDFGTTLDRNIWPGFAPPQIVADVQALPFKPGIADVIIFDPPFSKKFKPHYMNRYYADRRKVFRQVLDTLKPGGLLIFSHYFVPSHRYLHLERVYLIHNRPWEHVRALSFSRKKPALTSIYEEPGDNHAHTDNPKGAQ